MREDDEDSGDFGELVVELEEPALDEDDDAPLAAPELDTEEQAGDEALDDDVPHGLELGPDSVLPEEEEHAGDEAGVDEARSGETEPEDTLPADDEERNGIDDDQPLVSDLDLPGLDADESGDEDARRFGALLAAAEIELPSAERTWSSTRLAPERERCGALALARGTVVAGSTDLLWLDPGRPSPVRLALDGARIVGLTLLGERQEAVVAVTTLGHVLRRARLASDSERLGQLEHAPELGAPDARGLELCALGEASPHSFVVRSPAGTLLTSHDLGASLRALEPRLGVRAIASDSGLVAAISEDGSALLFSRDGKTFEPTALDRIGSIIATGQAPMLALSGGTIVLADPERGLALSRDAGRSFEDVPGCASVTACVAGSFGGRDSLWVALYSEAADRTRIALFDVGTGRGEVIAQLSGPNDDEGEQVPSARVEALGWDGVRLYAAGEAGFLLLEPPGGNSPH